MRTRWLIAAMSALALALLTLDNSELWDFSAHAARGFQAIGISVDDTAEKLKPYAAKYKMNYPVLVGLNHDDIQNAYGPLWGIPVTAIISRDGKICARHSGISSKNKFEKE